MSPKWRQRVVEVILFLWPVMPMRAKMWAFTNDVDLHNAYNYPKPD